MPLAPAVAGSWSIVSSPNAVAAQPKATFNGVTCVSASDCWAVGYYVNGTTGLYQTLIERWDGTSWAIVSSPNTSTTQYNYLVGVTCVSASDCWAVGSYYTGSAVEPDQGGVYQTLIERWDGTSWAIVTSPNAPASTNNYLSGVTCVSASECWAVGDYNAGNVAKSTVQTLIERWDGTSWAVVTSPNTSTTQHHFLTGVTCVSASECWAVGYFINGSTNQTLVERWDGTSWAIVTSPNTSATQSNQLNGVTCVSASDCWAVGTYYNSIINTYQTLIEQWNGTSWVIVTSPNALARQTNDLNAVTCVSASNCWAVGYYFDANGSGVQTLIERWDGTSWAVGSPPNTSTTQHPYLAAVTCVSASDCWAVGFYNTATTTQPLIERWDGTSWAVVSSANTSPTDSDILYGVTCVSAASDCWAVGYYNTGSAFQTLIERWNGTSWTIVTSPNTSTTQANVLAAVTCASASDCWAVGYYSVAGIANQTLIERWNGTSWAIVTSPNTLASTNNHLNGATCVSASECWAVGSYSSSVAGIADQTLIERWDGTSWVLVTSPNTSTTQANGLAAVTCVSASNCWAVGYYSTGSADQTLIERWDGTAWVLVTSPNTSTTQANGLAAVTCVSAADCWAVGYYSTGSADQTLIERWDGTSWAIVTSPNTSATRNNVLLGVTCVSAASDCWAAGYYVNASGVNQTLTEHYTASPPIPTSVVSRKTHGTAGTFDVNLPLTGNPGIECRSGGTNNDYQLLVTFANAVTFSSAAVTSGTGTVASTSGSGTTALTVNLTGVSNAQTITITLAGLNDGTTTGNVVIPMGVLIGDTSANGSVNSSDISQTKAQSGTAATSSNFREDVTVSGLINSSDISLVKSKSGTALP